MNKKRFAAIAVMSALSISLFFAHERVGFTPSEILGAVPEAGAKVPGEMTVEEWTTLAGAVSVANQEARYVNHAGVASFLLPGTGQFLTGDYAGGALYMGAEAAIIGGTAAACWFLLPEDLRDSSLSREERKTLKDEYSDEELMPAMCAASAGFVLMVVNSVFSSKDAHETALSNIDSGKVRFEPKIYLSGNHFGLGLVMNIR